MLLARPLQRIGRKAAIVSIHAVQLSMPNSLAREPGQNRSARLDAGLDDGGPSVDTFAGISAA
jgi:hypothetical protein